MKLKIDAGSIWLTKEYTKQKKVLSSLFRIKLPYNSYGFFLQESEIDTDKLLSDNIIILSPTVKYSLLEIKELKDRIISRIHHNYCCNKSNKYLIAEVNNVRPFVAYNIDVLPNNPNYKILYDASKKQYIHYSS